MIDDENFLNSRRGGMYTKSAHLIEDVIVSFL